MSAWEVRATQNEGLKTSIGGDALFALEHVSFLMGTPGVSSIQLLPIPTFEKIEPLPEPPPPTAEDVVPPAFDPTAEDMYAAYAAMWQGMV